jgi:glycosyltransferase involved in cell wall biosynthesis
MEKDIKVSIILPTYNGAKYISRAIESVLSQSFSDWELLIVDDGSTDDTENIIKEYANKDSRIKYLKNENNLGTQKTLNRGLKEAKGEYIGRIDEDDEWIDKDKLQKQIEFLDNNSEYVLVGTGAVFINEDRKELTRCLMPETDEKIRNNLLCKNNFIHSSVVFRRNAVLQSGGYAEKKETREVEDYDLWLRLGLVSKMYNLPEYSTLYMTREGGFSSRNRLNQLKKGIKLSKEYKGKYPNYFRALFVGYTRLLFYGYLIRVPIIRIPLISLKNKIFTIYKEA